MFAGAKLVGFKIVAGAKVKAIIAAAQCYFVHVFSSCVVNIIIAIHRALADIGYFKNSALHYLPAQNGLPFANR